MYDESPFSIISPNNITSNSISLNTSSPNLDVGGKSDVEELRNQVRKLEAENLALRRSLPRIRDLAGEDVTDEIAELTGQLAKVEARLEEIDNMYAQKHEEFTRLHSAYVEMEAAKNAEIHSAIQRAIYFEQENERLQKQLEDDESRLFHFNEQQQKPHANRPPLSNESALLPSLRIAQAEISRRNEELGARLLAATGESESAALRQHLGELNDEQASLSYSSASQPSVIESGDARRRRRRLATTSFCDLMHMDGAVSDAVNRTVLDVTHNMHTVAAHMTALQTVCRQLFDKLSGTAMFLEKLVSALNDGDSEEARQIAGRIRDIKFDLDKSMSEAQYATDVLARSRQSLVDLRMFVEQTAIDGGNTSPATVADDPHNQSSRPLSQATSEKSVRSTSSAPASICGGPSSRSLVNIELNKAVDYLTKTNATLKNTLNKELALKDTLDAELNECRGRVRQLETQLHDVHADLGQYREIINKQRCDLEAQAHHLNKYYAERQGMIELNKARDEKMKEMQTSGDAMSAQIQELDRTCRNLFEEKTEVQRRLEQTRLELETESEKVQHLRISNIDCDKLNRDLHTRMTDLKRRHDELIKNYGRTNDMIDVANLNVYRKVNDGLKVLQLSGEDSLMKDVMLTMNDFNVVTDPHGAYCHEEFTAFLADCQRRSSHIVGLLKKSEEVMSAKRTEHPFMPHLMAEARAVRMMLYKIHGFFNSQRENKNPSKRISCREICAELKRIYTTMTSSYSVTHDAQSSMLQLPTSGTAALQRSDRCERPKDTAPTTMRGGTASDDASLRQTPQAWPVVTTSGSADNRRRGPAGKVAVIGADKPMAGRKN